MISLVIKTKFLLQGVGLQQELPYQEDLLFNEKALTEI